MREGGKEEFVNKGEKEKIRSNQILLGFFDTGYKGLSSPGWDSWCFR